MKNLLVITLIALLSCSGRAQEKPDKKERAQKLMTEMDNRLDLTEDQETEVKVIFKDFAESAKELGKGNREERQTLAEERDQKMSKVLSAEQYEEYLIFIEEKKQDMKARIQERRMHGGSDN